MRDDDGAELSSGVSGSVMPRAAVNEWVTHTRPVLLGRAWPVHAAVVQCWSEPLVLMAHLFIDS